MTMRIVYLFCDHGAEAEALSRYGQVTRYTIDPEFTRFVDTTHTMDLMETKPMGSWDLAVAHPICTPFSPMPNVDPDAHENQIPRARDICEDIADDYIIENLPTAPLKDPVVLDGRMFGLPIRYERAFETTFRTEQPPRTQRLAKNAETSPFFYSERSRAWWASVKGVRPAYPPEHLAKNVIPSPYIDWLLRQYLEATGRAENVGDYSKYEEEMDTKQKRELNEQLTAFERNQEGEP